MSVSTSENWVIPAEAARFLRLEPADIKRSIEKDQLPCTKIPKRTRNTLRIYIRDLHAWILARTENPSRALLDFETFRADLLTHRQTSKQ